MNFCNICAVLTFFQPIDLLPEKLIPEKALNKVAGDYGEGNLWKGGHTIEKRINQSDNITLFSMKSITELTNYRIKPGVIYEANDCFQP